MPWSGHVSARTVANLGIASALTIFLGACGSMSLHVDSPAAAPEPGVAPEMPATIRADEIVGRWGLASFQNPNDRARTEAAAKGQCKQPYVIGAGTIRRRDHASGRPGDAAGTAPQGQPERQELYRPARTGRRRAGSRDRLVRRPRADHPLHRQGCRDPLRQHGLCPLRARAPESRQSSSPASKRRLRAGRFDVRKRRLSALRADAVANLSRTARRCRPARRGRRRLPASVRSAAWRRLRGCRRSAAHGP